MASQDFVNYKMFIDNLKHKEQRCAALNEIKSLLSYKSGSEAVSAIRNSGISKIVQCLNVTDTNQIDLTCEVLRLCFEKFEPGDVIRNYTGHIMYLLRHENVCVRKVAIEEVYKTLTTNPCLLPVSEYVDVFVAVAQMGCDNDVGITNKSILITSNLPLEAYPKVLDEMKILLEGNNSSKCNAYEVVINISTKSFELFTQCTDHKYIDFMVSELQSDDILYQLNILELLSQLAVKPYGINYVVKCGALNKIVDMVKDLQNSPLRSLLTPGYMKFFGIIAHHYPKEILERYPILVESLFYAFESDEGAILPVALDTLGFIGATVEGKLCLAALGSDFTKTIEKVCQAIKNSPTEIKVRATYCLSCLVKVNDDTSSAVKTVDQRITLMTREWFRSLNKQPEAMAILFENCKNPFPEIKLASFTLLGAVCQHRWGEEMVASIAGFIEYLLDRTTSFSKEEKQAKYDIIKMLSNSTAFDDNLITRLKTYVEQGPFYSETIMQVVMEEGE